MARGTGPETREFEGVPANVCSRVPPPEITLPSARIGEAKITLNGYAPEKSAALVLTFHRSAPLAWSRAWNQPSRSPK